VPRKHHRLSITINAGVYVLDPAVLNLMLSNNYCDMPQLFELIGMEGMRTIAYPMHEPWLDVGREDDLNKALRVMTDGIGQND
jgi:NDP-sugar pyrophosphorylase family protein